MASSLFSSIPDYDHISDDSTDRKPPAKLEQPRCPVNDCNIKKDIFLGSSDGRWFAAHTPNLHQFSEGFPTSDSVTMDPRAIRLTETGEVLSLMLQFMHHVRQPDLTDLPVSTLSELAEAAEKYIIHSAMGLCTVLMNMSIPEQPVEVLIYAFKHDYPKLAKAAAPFTLGTDASVMATKAAQANLHHTFIVAWLGYRDAWANQMRSLAKEPYKSGSLLHKGGYAECELWKPYHREVLADIGIELSGLARLEDIIRENISEMLDDCSYCTRRANRWAGIVKTAHETWSSQFMV